MARRILLLITDLEIGGTPTVVRELAIRLRDSGASVEVASLKTAGPNGAILAAAGIPVTPFQAGSVLSFPFVIRKLRRLIRTRRIDVVFSFLVHANVVAAAAVPSDVTLLQSIQTTQPHPAWHWKAQRWAARRAQRIIVPSHSIVETAIARSHIPRDRFVVIPNAIDPDAFPRSEIPLNPPAAYPVGFIGRLDPVKRVTDLIEAMPASGMTLKIFGDGPERDRLERLRQTLGRCPITLHGAIPRPQDALAQLGLLVLPSEAEGFGLVLIEAMAAGVPVIGTSVPGIRDVIQHEVNGLLVPLAQPAVLRSALQRIATDTPLRTRLIQAGLQTVRARYTWNQILPQYRAALNVEC